MPLSDVVVLSFTALITMVNPLAVLPSFVMLTDGESFKTRASVAFVASIACVGVLTVFLLAGNYVRVVEALKEALGPISPAEREAAQARATKR